MKIKKWFQSLLGGEIIASRKIDRQLPFIFFCFVLISLHMMWGLWVEDRMAAIKRNNQKIEELKIEYHEKALRLTGLNQRTKIETMLIEEGNQKLHAPVAPPQRIELK